MKNLQDLLKEHLQEYVKMCQNEIIQNAWNPCPGDLYYDQEERKFSIISAVEEAKKLTKEIKNKEWKNGKFVWIPFIYQTFYAVLLGGSQ